MLTITMLQFITGLYLFFLYVVTYFLRMVVVPLKRDREMKTIAAFKPRHLTQAPFFKVDWCDADLLRHS